MINDLYIPLLSNSQEVDEVDCRGIRLCKTYDDVYKYYKWDDRYTVPPHQVCQGTDGIDGIDGLNGLYG